MNLQLYEYLQFPPTDLHAFNINPTKINKYAICWLYSLAHNDYHRNYYAFFYNHEIYNLTLILACIYETV